MSKQKNHAPAFKAKVALAAVSRVFIERLCPSLKYGNVCLKPMKPARKPARVRETDRLLQPDPATQQPGRDNPRALLQRRSVKGSPIREKTS